MYQERVAEWINRNNREKITESPPDSPCYDYPMSENEEDIWEMPPGEELDDDNITLINYEPASEPAFPKDEV